MLGIIRVGDRGTTAIDRRFPSLYLLIYPQFAFWSRRHRLSQSSRAASGSGAAQGTAAGASSGAAAGPGSDRRLQLATYLPAKVVAAFREAGLTSDLYPWQVPSWLSSFPNALTRPGRTAPG